MSRLPMKWCRFCGGAVSIPEDVAPRRGSLMNAFFEYRSNTFQNDAGVCFSCVGFGTPNRRDRSLSR